MVILIKVEKKTDYLTLAIIAVSLTLPQLLMFVTIKVITSLALAFHSFEDDHVS